MTVTITLEEVGPTLSFLPVRQKVKDARSCALPQALCHATELPPAVLQFLLHPQRSSGPATSALRSTGLPQGLQSALQRLHNPSQQAAIAAALDERQGFVSLIQVWHYYSSCKRHQRLHKELRSLKINVCSIC